MVSEARIIGVDLDNVVTDTDGLFRQIVERIYGIKIRRDDVLDFYYHLSGLISREQEAEAFRVFHEIESLNVSLLDGATEALKEMRKSYEVYIVTSRPDSSRDVTERFLRDYEIPYDKLIFERQKVSLVKGWRAFIEDNRETAYDIARVGVLTFIFDYPWNQPKTTDPELIVRVKSWREVLQYLDGGVESEAQ
jgi:uncharacterized HAD superfamily protein